jgi:hypothetical protein
MHIERPIQSLIDAEQTKEVLNTFLRQPSPKAAPPCPGCKNHLPYKCSPLCAEAKVSLSAQADEFPLEPNVLPLVYGFMSTRLTQTCWSCEGHMDVDNNLLNLPMVSFYTSSPVYCQLIHRHIFRLNMDKKLNYPWQVVFTDYAQTWAQTYSIVPNLNFVRKDVSLGALQNDLKVMADNMQEKLKFIARELIIELDKWIMLNNAK